MALNDSAVKESSSDEDQRKLSTTPKINLSIFKFKFHVRALQKCQKCTRVSGKTRAKIELSSTLGKGKGNTTWHSDDDEDGLDKGATYVRLKVTVYL